MSRKVLVTGSGGFIGRHLVELLCHQGYQVYGLDKDTPKTAPVNWQFELCDILDAGRLSAVLKQVAPELVFHLAARTDLEEKKSLDGYVANIQGIRNLVGAIAVSTVKRAIFTSSKLVCPDGYRPLHDRDYAPHTLYGESKVWTEKIVWESDGGGVEWCLVRPSTVWGPGMISHYQKFLRMVKRGTYFHVGRRPVRKNNAYVGNVVYQFLKLMEAPVRDIHRQVFYLGDYHPVDVREWVNAFQRAFAAPPIRTIPEPVAKLAGKVGDVINAVGLKRFPFNSTRLKNVLSQHQFDLSRTEHVCGPLPYSLDQGVRETVKWFNEQCPA